MPEEDVMRFIAKNGEKVTLRLAGCQDAEEIISVIKTNAPDRSYVLMEHYGTKSEAVKKYICSMDFEKNLLIVSRFFEDLTIDVHQRFRQDHFANVVQQSGGEIPMAPSSSPGLTPITSGSVPRASIAVAPVSDERCESCRSELKKTLVKL